MVKKAEVEKLMDEIRPEMRRMLDTVAYETFKDLLDNAFKRTAYAARGQSPRPL